MVPPQCAPGLGSWLLSHIGEDREKHLLCQGDAVTGLPVSSHELVCVEVQSQVVLLDADTEEILLLHGSQPEHLALKALREHSNIT